MFHAGSAQAWKLPRAEDVIAAKSYPYALLSCRYIRVTIREDARSDAPLPSDLLFPRGERSGPTNRAQRGSRTHKELETS